MKRAIGLALVWCMGAPLGSTQGWWDEVIPAQTEAYELGKTQRTEASSQREILFCKAHWEGFSEAIGDQKARLFAGLTQDKVHETIDYWAAQLEISDYDAELETADAAYYALIYFGPLQEQRIEATRKLGTCAPFD